MTRAVKQIVRKYYKYIYTSWAQPTLSSNTSNPNMVLSGDSTAYKLFDNNGSTSVLTASAKTITITFSEYHSLTDMTIYSVHTSSYWANPRTITISYYKEGTQEWIQVGSITGITDTYTKTTTLDSNTAKIYKIVIPAYTSNGYGSQVNSITLQGTERTTVESTVEDYDFYRDVDVYKVPKTNNTYYGVNQ